METEEKINLKDCYNHFSMHQKLKNDEVLKTEDYPECPDCACELTIGSENNLICSNCGLDYGNTIDDSAEWKFYNDDNRTSDPTRCGASINPILIESSYCTNISYSNNPIYKRISKTNKWLKQSYLERSAREVFILLSQIGNANGITPNIIEYSHRLFYEVITEQAKNPDKTSSRGDFRDGLISACLAQACKEFDVARSAQEIARMCDIDNSDVTRGKNLFNELMRKSEYVDLSKDIIKYNSFIDRYCSILGLSIEQTECIGNFADKVQSMKILSKNTPESMLCGCIYFVSVMHNYGISRQDISTKCGTSIPTINKVYEKLLQHTHELI